MVYEIPGFSYTLPAGADFSVKATTGQFRFVDVNASGQAVAPATGGTVVGVRQNLPASGQPTTVVESGIVFLEAGAAITAGAIVTTDNTGRVIAAGTGNLQHGRALEAASGAGIQIAVLLKPVPAAHA
jgi:spore maturation protein SpmA